MEDQVKETRTQRLLRLLGLDDTFYDHGIPKGVFSYSQYNSYKICGKAYEYKYIDDTKVPAYAATTKGQSVHCGIEFLLTAKKMGRAALVEEGVAALEKRFEEDAKSVKSWGDFVPGKVKDEAIALLKAFAVYGLPKINPLEIEKGFAKRIGNVPMIGWIDVIDEQPAIVVSKMSPEEQALAPKQRVVVDFKTGRAKWSENELRKDTQLTLYSHVEGTPHVRIDQLLTMKSGPRFIQGSSVREPQDAEVLIEDINETAEFIKAGIFPKTDIGHWSCNTEHCTFYHLCRGRKR